MKSNNRTTKVGQVSAILLGLIGGLSSAFSGERPNILLIQVDDLGYSDLGIHGNTVIQTPSLDRLGEESMRFDRFYVHPLCAPTRASLLSGKHFWRVGVYGVHAGTDFMNLEETTVAEIMRDAGYRTGMWGKWHSGKTDGYFPWDRGFEEAFMADLYEYQDNEGRLNGEPVQTDGWTPAVLTDFAIDFMRKDSPKPFFAYVSYLSPHGPWTAPEDYIEPYTSAGFSEHASTLFGMITHLDFQIGRLLEAVDQSGLRDSTLVLFISDNGPARNVKGQPVTIEEWEQRVAPLELRGHKSSPYENGIRSPLFIRWGDRLPAVADSRLLSVEDLLPTFAELAGAEIPYDLDGQSFAGLLENSETEWPDRTLFFSSSYPRLPKGMSRQQARLEKSELPADLQLLTVMSDDFKFLKQGDSAELFAFPDDIREQNNLASEQPETAEALRDMADAWFGEIISEPGSFTRPLLLVGHEGNVISRIPAYCLAGSRGGLRNANHTLNNWRNPGDAALFDLDIQTPGNYTIEVEFAKPVSSPTRMQVQISGQTVELTVFGETPSKNLTSSEPVQLEMGPASLEIELITPLDNPASVDLVRIERSL